MGNEVRKRKEERNRESEKKMVEVCNRWRGVEIYEKINRLEISRSN